MSAFRKIFSIKNSHLNNLYQRCLYLCELEKKLKKQLDHVMRDHFNLANVNEDSVLILTHSSSWATRLRYHTPEILNIFQQQLNHKSIKNIRIRVKKIIPSRAVSNYQAMTLSKNTAHFLTNAAQDFTDPVIQDRILKLSKNAQ